MTIKSIDADTPKGMFTYNQYKIGLPKTFTVSPFYISQTPHNPLLRSTILIFPQSADIASQLPNNNRGAKIAELLLQTDGAFDSGNGGSFLLKFSINGRPTAHPEAEECNVTGTLHIGTSEWGTISRPDTTTFAWTIDAKKAADAPDGSATSLHRTYTADTPTLGYLQDSCITFGYDAELKAYAFGLSNQQDLLIKILQGGVGGIITGHKLLWTAAAGWVLPFGGPAVGVVVWVASKVDGL